MQIRVTSLIWGSEINLSNVLGDREAKIQISAPPFWQKKQDPIQFGPS